MKILVVENNSIVASDIVISLSDMGYEVVKWVKTGKEALEAVHELAPDLIIMDINLDGPMDGIQAAELVSKIQLVPIIYLTAYSDNTTFERAKKTHPFAYLVKPFVEKDLGFAIDLAIDNFSKQPQASTITTSPTEHLVLDAVFLKVNKHYIKILLRDILYVQAERSYCKVFTVEKIHLLTMSLHTFETKLNSQDFVRVSRSALVNIHHVDSFENHSVWLGDQEIRISRSFQDAFQSKFLSI
ncbi:MULTISPECIES: response regulator [unclassified Imperialibacter]|uniref:response regulator n=1 Tax=unclassified Imperialibacter TaxID=2629706 RepID=UPI001251BE3A|nr:MULTISPECIES: response regulator [unclassified Imperialibacter]CAD5290345.1 Two component transcriptional regulator, LytTR family [Imperialibacter sp. 89]CAD5290643.1 Two component transcriptional regulator, LytTR family [Imperialibacter sp. 75]VVT34470.1 Two component transcriptional regulator, LytTR family [Imperialibacter sp. EC-SDR9]